MSEQAEAIFGDDQAPFSEAEYAAYCNAHPWYALSCGCEITIEEGEVGCRYAVCPEGLRLDEEYRRQRGAWIQTPAGDRPPITVLLPVHQAFCAHFEKALAVWKKQAQRAYLDAMIAMAEGDTPAGRDARESPIGRAILRHVRKMRTV